MCSKSDVWFSEAVFEITMIAAATGSGFEQGAMAPRRFVTWYEPRMARDRKSEGLSAGMRWGTFIAPVIADVVPRIYKSFQGRRRDTWPMPIAVDHWTAISDGLHNLTTDMIWWRGHYYLVHANSPWHMASANSRLVLWRSSDTRSWEQAAQFQLADGDIRDPKLAVIGGRLFLYVLRNDGLIAEPSGTAFTVSDDGIDWRPLQPCGPRGWLFWRPKSRGDGVWYVPAYWHRHGRSILLESSDGETWTEVSEINKGGHNDETDLEFMPDGTAVITARLEISPDPLGHDRACTLVATAPPPYRQWDATRCPTTRLDGPNLFSHNGVVYAAGRHHPAGTGRFDKRAGVWGRRKRTALYRVDKTGLRHLFDLPSAGDTGYPGVVVRGDELTLCYYTNDVASDPPWLVGMFLPSEIRIAKLSLRDLATL